MMSSMGSTRGNSRGGGGGREKSSVAKTNAQTSGKSSTAPDHGGPVGKKATPDQMRLAQIYSDGSSEDNTKEKIRQVQDVVPKSEDEVLVALHDCNYDTGKAIMLLLEREEGDQQGEWETISRKTKQRGVTSSGFRNNSDAIGNSKDNGQDKDTGRDRRDNRGNKDRDGSGKDKDRDRDGHREGGGRDGERERGNFGGRGRGRNNRGQLPPRMTRGRGRENDSTSRERDKNERNRWDGGESGRGRGRRGYDHMNGPSRRGRGPRSFTNSKFASNLEDDAFKPGDNVWTNPPAETENNTWDNSMSEDWGAEDWSGDDAALNGGCTELPQAGGVGQPNWMTALTESKVFMASSTPPTTTPITLDTIESQSSPMVPPSSLNAPNSMSPGSSLAPSSSIPQSTMPEMSHGISLAQLFAKPVSAAPVNNQGLGTTTGLGGGSGMGGLGSTSLGGSTGLGSVGGDINISGIGSSGMGSTGIGGAGTIGTSPGIGGGLAGSSGLGTAIGSSAGMVPGSIADSLSQRQTSTSVFSAYVDLKPPAPVSEPSKAAGQVQQLGGAPSEPPSATVPSSQLSANQHPVQHRVQVQASVAAKPSKKRLPPPSTKIPASAVEMPGPVPARGLTMLDVQFGAMDINMEPPMPDFEVGSISTGSVPNAVSVSLSSDAYSVSETSTAAHLSYAPNVSDSSYPSQSLNSSLMANSTSTTMAPGLDQTGRSVYAQSGQNRQMTPDPIPMPTQDLKGNGYIQQPQKPSPTPLETKSDKQHAPSHTAQLSAITSHPSSLASSMSLSSSGMSSGGGLHSQIGLSSHVPSHQSQSLGSTRQAPNSGHSGVVYGSSAPTVSHPSSVYSSVHSNLVSGHSSVGLSSSGLTVSGLPSGPGGHPSGQSSIGGITPGGQSGHASGVQGGLPVSSGLSATAQLSGVVQLSSNAQMSGSQMSGSQLAGSQLSGSQLPSGSQLSNSSQLSSGAQLSAASQLSNSSQLPGSSVQLSNSGHPPSSISVSLNSVGLSATPSSNTHSTHTSVQTSPLTQGKLAGLDNRIHPGSNQHVMDHNSHQSSLGPSSLSSGPSSLSSSMSHPSAASSGLTTTTATSPFSVAGSASSLGYSSPAIASATMTTTTASTGIRATTIASGSKLPNLPPGMSFLPNQQYIMGHGLPLVNTFAAHQPFYNYEEFQMQLSRMPGAAAAMGYSYDLQQFQQPPTTLTAARDVSSLSSTPYSVTEASKFTRGDASSPVAASSLSAQPAAQQPTQHATGSHHTQPAQQQPALFNAAAPATIPPGYGYAGGLPYYPGPAGLIPPGLQYPPAGAVFPAVSSVQPANRSQPATTTLHSGFQQSAYGSHGAYGTGYDDLTQTQDFAKSGYSGVSQTQKTATGAAAGSSAASASVGAPDISGSSYTSKTHAPSGFPDKQSFHGTPPPFSFPLASANQTGPLNPAATAYPQHPFVPMMQHHGAAAATILPQQLHGDSHAGSSQRTQGTTGPAKQSSKQSYGSTYWSAN